MKLEKFMPVKERLTYYVAEVRVELHERYKKTIISTFPE